MNYADELQTVYDQWRERLWNEGRELGLEQGREAGVQEGRLQAMRDDLTLVYQARFGALSPALTNAIEAVSDVAILRSWLVPFATRPPEEIATLVLDPAPPAPPM